MSEKKPTFKVATLKRSSVPKRKSVYDWDSYFGSLEKNPENALKFSGLARTTIRQAIERYNAVAGHRKLIMQGRKADTYVYFEEPETPEEPETEE